MRQKVVIACGLVRDASVLLFDEPLTGLDPIGIRRMRDTITRRARAGAAILVSSHLLHLVEEVCTRVIIMDRGHKVADGTVQELASRAEIWQPPDRIWSRSSCRSPVTVRASTLPRTD